MTKIKSSYLFPLLLVFYEITTYLSNDMYLPALPQMMQDLQLNTADAQMTLMMWFIGEASMPLLMGILADRYGRRPILLTGGVIYILATIFCALATTKATLLIGRFFEGAMVASMLVPGYAAIHELFDRHEAVRMLALMGSISVLAPAFGPLLGGIVLYFLPWRSIFWIITLLAFFAVISLMKWMPETHPVSARVPVNFIKLSKSYGTVLANSQFILLMFTLGGLFAGFLAWISAGSLLVIANFHYSAITFGWIQATVFAAYIFGNRCVKYLLGKMTMNQLMQLGLVLALAGGILLFLTAYYFSQQLFLFIAALMIFSFGAGLSFAPLNRSIIETSSEPMGIRMALFAVFLSGFAALGSGLSSLFFNGSLLSLAAIITTTVIIANLLKWLYTMTGKGMAADDKQTT